MELKDFVAQSITEISQGIIKAQAANHANGILIAPHVKPNGAIAKDVNEEEKPQVLHFDLHVTVTDANSKGKKGGKLKVQVASFGVSAESGDDNHSSMESRTEQRITFDIPVIWPTTQQQEDWNKYRAPEPKRSWPSYD